MSPEARTIFRACLLLALLFPASPAPAAEDREFSILTQAASDPGEAGEILVFVGEQVAYEPLEMNCGEGCWVFDSWYTARYRVSQWIHGVPPGEEITFEVAEHAVIAPFGHSRFALVFVEKHGESLSLVKYQQVPVYPTAGGSFASCGPVWGRDPGDRRPLDPEEPELEDIAFLPPLVVDETGRLSAHGRRYAHDPRWFEAVGDKIHCRRGVPVERLVPAIVRGHPTLLHALPELAGTGP